jgi:trafficking protein particle complex subunit 5
MNKRNVMDSNIKTKKEIPVSMFSFLFSEIIQYITKKPDSNKEYDFEEQLSCFGYPIGEKMLELLSLREKSHKREVKIVNMLQLVHNVLWKHLFNKQADGIQRSTDDPYEYRILENNPIVNKYISQKGNNYNCVSFLAGIIEGFLNSAGFKSKVSAYYLDGNSETPGKTFYIIKFDKEIVDKDDEKP